MRVAIVTLYPSDPQRIAGGIRMVSYNLVQALRRYPDLDLHVVHCHSDISEDAHIVETLEGAREALPDRVLVAPSNVSTAVGSGCVTLHYLAMPKQRLVPNLMTSVWRVRRLLRDLAPDVVHAHVGQYAWAAVSAGLPTVYTIHGVLAREREVYRDTLFDRWRYGLLAHYEARALPRVDRLVAISPYVREAYSQARARWQRCAPTERRALWERIDNPVPQAFFDVTRRPEAGRLLYAGSITEIKDLLTLLHAVERVSATDAQVHLRIAGRSTSPAYERLVRDLASHQALRERVAFLGLLDREQLLEEYARCAALVLSSVQENAPMAVIEAMAAGAPVVATRVGGVPDLVAEGETGYLVPPGDDAALAEALRRVLRDPATATQMGARGRQVALGRFHSDQVAQAYYELYVRVQRDHE